MITGENAVTGEEAVTGAGSGTWAGRVDVDVDQVAAVAAFYRRAAHVVGAAADEVGDHDFGSWAHGADYGGFGQRFAAVGATLARRLAAHAGSAARLSAALDDGVEAVVESDAGAAAVLRAPVDGGRA
ncbi:MAG: hypothetical protein QM662_13215 [Gordonia sp. (in: high G+C Gram-positive bacteria)]